jgi:uncharacterized protein (DUF427 family)
MTRPVKVPDASHPITVQPTSGQVTVHVRGFKVADSRKALSLAEATYPVVQYVPNDDVDFSALRRTETTSYCPFKGEASYYSIQTPEGETLKDVIWTYEQPYPVVAEIAGHLAFYPDRADITITDS